SDPELYYDRSAFGRYDTFGYRFQAIGLNRLENVPQEIDDVISKIQIHLFSGQQSRQPFVQVSWSPSTTDLTLDTVSKQDTKIRKLKRLSQVSVPMLDKLLEIDYSKSEWEEKEKVNGTTIVD